MWNSTLYVIFFKIQQHFGLEQSLEILPNPPNVTLVENIYSFKLLFLITVDVNDPWSHNILDTIRQSYVVEVLKVLLGHSFSNNKCVIYTLLTSKSFMSFNVFH